MLLRVARGVRRRQVIATAGTAAGAGAVAGVAAACQAGGGEPVAARKLKTGITLQMGSTGAAPLRVGLHARQAQLFKDKFPGIEVEIVPDGESLDKIRTTIVAGSPLDLVAQNTTRFSALVAQGAVLALDPLIQRDRYDLRGLPPPPAGDVALAGQALGPPQQPVAELHPVPESDARRGGGRAPPAGHVERPDVGLERLPRVLPQDHPPRRGAHHAVGIRGHPRRLPDVHGLGVVERQIRHIPATIVQGRFDIVCPMRSAWDLHKAWPEADLRIVPESGHSAFEPGTSRELVKATDRYSRK